MNVEFVTADCIEYMNGMRENSVDVVVTSPPYNLSMEYGEYNDKKPMDQYLDWTAKWTEAVFRVLKEEGSFFLNVGGSSTNPWIGIDVANIVRKNFVLQNHVVWVKSISIYETSHGHFKPRNSNRFLNRLHEDVYHFTKTGDVKLDRLAVGVPFMHPSNTKRWHHKKDRRCRGDVWYIPYKTIQSKEERGYHPAPFPAELPEMCIKVHGLERCDLVLDPFGGIGNTAIACGALNKSCLSVDIDAEYTAIARRYYAKLYEQRGQHETESTATEHLPAQDNQEQPASNGSFFGPLFG